MMAAMNLWTCPSCGRSFGRTRQSHACLPGNSVDESFAGQPPEHRAAYDAIARHLRSLGPFHEDAVQVGVFLKRDRTLAEVRPRVRSVSLELVLDRVVDHPRISRRIPISGGRAVHCILLTHPDQVDDQVRDWLTEAYDAAGDS
jgi:hypothetical protein